MALPARCLGDRARSGERDTLLERDVVVRVAPFGAVAVEKGKPVRVLLVFAEAPGARPLAARLERERLLDLFFGDVLPSRNVDGPHPA